MKFPRKASVVKAQADACLSPIERWGFFCGLVLVLFTTLLFFVTRNAADQRLVEKKARTMKTYVTMAYECRQMFPRANGRELHECAISRIE